MIKTPRKIVRENGDIGYYVNGKFHRTDGPAFIYADGTQEWWINDELHRDNGPAIEWPDGSYSWYLDNNYYDTVDDYLNANDYIDDEDRTLLKLQYG